MQGDTGVESIRRMRNAIDGTTLNMEDKDKKRLHDAMLKLDKEDLEALFDYFHIQERNSYDEGYNDAIEDYGVMPNSSQQ